MLKRAVRYHRLARHGARARGRRRLLLESRLAALLALARVGRPRLHPRLRARAVARDRGACSAGRSARLGTISVASVLVVLAILVAINYISSREHKRWDLTATERVHAVAADGKVLQELDAPLKMTVFARETEFPRYKERLPEYEYVSKKVTVDYVDPDKKPALAKQIAIQSVRHDRGRVQGPDRARHRRLRAGHHQRHHQGGDRAGAEGVLHAGPRREGHDAAPSGPATTPSPRSSGATTTRSTSSCSRSRPRCRPTRRRSSSPGRRPTSCPPEIDALKRYLEKGGKLLLMLDPPEKADAPAARQPDRPRARLGHRRRQQRRRRRERRRPAARHRRDGPGGRDATRTTRSSTSSTCSRPSRWRAPSPRSGRRRPGGSRRRSSRRAPRSWAETDIAGAAQAKGEVKLDEDKGDKRGPDLDRGGRVRGRRRTRQPGRHRAATTGQKKDERAEAGDARGRRSATPTSPPTSRSASRATATCS